MIIELLPKTDYVSMTDNFDEVYDFLKDSFDRSKNPQKGEVYHTQGEDLVEEGNEINSMFSHPNLGVSAFRLENNAPTYMYCMPKHAREEDKSNEKEMFLLEFKDTISAFKYANELMVVWKEHTEHLKIEDKDDKTPLTDEEVKIYKFGSFFKNYMDNLTLLQNQLLNYDSRVSPIAN